MTPSIRDNFCPKCGKPTQGPGLCTDCRVSGTPWFTCDHRVKHTQCPSCGATKSVNTWTDSALGRDEIGPELAKSAVHFHPEVRKPEIRAEIEDISANRSRASLFLKGIFYKAQVEGTCSVEILWNKEQCDRCNRISGSYYEGVVQVRAEGRIPSTYELQLSASIAQQIEDNLQAGGERLSFISDMNEIRDGLDIIIGSQHIGLLISQAIVAQLGGRYTTHPKLVGEKNGRQLFRITYSVRLPKFQRYDVVVARKRHYEVERVEPRYVRAFDLSDGSSRSLREEDIGRILGNARSAKSALVAFAEEKTIGVMDPVSCQTHECRRPAWLDARAGDHIAILRDGDELVIVR